MDVDELGAASDEWYREEKQYRRHLIEHGVSNSSADAICLRMAHHFVKANVEFGVWGEMPAPAGITSQQQAEIVAGFSQIVERMATEVQGHTKRMLWQIFELEILIEQQRNEKRLRLTQARPQLH